MRHPARGPATAGIDGKPISPETPTPGRRHALEGGGGGGGVASLSSSVAPALWAVGWALLALSVPTFVLALTPALDARTIAGVSIWLKPWKFQFSAAVFLLTLAWAVERMPWLRDTRRLRVVSAIAIGTSIAEVVYITWRGARGEPSHFYTATLSAKLLFTAMGIAAAMLTATAVAVGVFAAHARDFFGTAVMQRAVAWGFVGGGVLALITGFTLGAHGSHWVGGTPTDAGGLPLLHWSRDGGDLRVPHFFGLHLMQALPLLAWGLEQSRITARSALHVVMVTAVAGVGLTVATFAQALAGRPWL